MGHGGKRSREAPGLAALLPPPTPSNTASERSEITANACQEAGARRSGDGGGMCQRLSLGTNGLHREAELPVTGWQSELVVEVCL